MQTISKQLVRHSAAGELDSHTTADAAAAVPLGVVKTAAQTVAAPLKIPIAAKAVVTAFALGGAIAASITGAWAFGWLTAFQNHVLLMSFGQQTALTAAPLALIFAVTLGVGVAVACVTERFGVRRVAPFVGGFAILMFVLGVAAAHLLHLDIAPVAVIVAATFTLLAAQIEDLWAVDRQLTDNVRRLAHAGHALEGKRADVRLTGALELLGTVLPLDEIVVFQLDERGALAPIGRNNRDSAQKANERQNEWREGIELCEAAIAAGNQQVKVLSETKGARVAVPMTHGGVNIGALLVRFRENFEADDSHVLDAFAAQLARNFQRHQTRTAAWQNRGFERFSTRAARHRLEAFRLVDGLLIEQQFGSLALSEMVDGYAVSYLDGTIAFVNRAMLRAAQITYDRARQIDLLALLERFQGGVFDDPRIAIRRVLQTGERYQHEVVLNERNQTFDLQIALVREEPNIDAPGAGEVGRPLCFLITVRNITAQKENERLRSDMVSLMSHELRTPITSINGFAELLMLDDNIPEESQEFLKIISNESQRLSRMLTTFLAVSQLEQSDKREVVKIPVRLDGVVHEVVGTLQQQARAKRIRLVEQAATHLPPVAGDKGMITKVVAQLVDNAIRYSPERTTVTIQTVLEADAVRVTVEDRGYGIPSESIEKVWEKFYRVPRDGQDKNETSTGLGLALVKEVVEQHGGTVGVESQPGQGSKFNFTLPRL